MSKPAAALLALACSLAHANQTWDFDVRLDDRPIGTHRFTVGGPPAAREVHSQARLDVKLLGLTVFRYRHEARERWRGDLSLRDHSSNNSAHASDNTRSSRRMHGRKLYQVENSPHFHVFLYSLRPRAHNRNRAQPVLPSHPHVA